MKQHETMYEMDHEMRVMSFNIRNGQSEDYHVNGWGSRAKMVAGLIRFHRPDIAGLQEVLVNQVEDLQELLPEYAFVGVGREDGVRQGEFVSILYLKQRFDALVSGSFWLSEQPDQAGSMGWDAACTRVTTWVKLRDRRTDTEFVHLNTHFDHVGTLAVEQSAYLLRERAAHLAGAYPVIVTGDFNFTSNSTAYPILCGKTGEDDLHLKDAAEAAYYKHFGPSFTFHGFDTDEVAMQLFPEHRKDEQSQGLEFDSPIDFIFVDEQVNVRCYGIIGDHHAGQFPSDHFPIVADIIWR
ncbi:endonuclease/exonuclease/phosphatase family protein [Paenibacillus sp. ACRRX]|uniref:endonuclease/exonuclease/phosphatase family protein n=1 Tax=unclassified Paenibacillus TaxID=185978 RepID=UPI001EF5E555|nr:MULTISPECIES: endonuclease/exonuclease/phosphatase family protein [unclassified Paenibacillus]MCG7409666.1 endonuclease/exonuclease/phosphatase family protein [Paenibacillus sp. ACRRX]MDK8183256.1 endonuclease/exonuclease/phosphatase family protein [Paenibacillus sp. UMB4589-SE434]